MTADDHSGPSPDTQAASASSRKGPLRRITDFFDNTTKVLLAIGGLDQR